MFIPSLRATSVILIVTLFLASCSDSPTSPSNDNGNADYSDHYLPLSVGSTWTYSGFEYTLTVTGTTTKDDKTYAALRTQELGGADSTSWARKVGSTYYSLTSSRPSEQVLLKEEPVGTTWTIEYTDPAGTTSNRTVFEIESYDQERTVNGMVYSDILHVASESQFNITGTWQTFSRGDIYYARGIGLIEENFQGFVTQNVRLESFNVVGSSATAVPE